MYTPTGTPAHRNVWARLLEAAGMPEAGVNSDRAYAGVHDEHAYPNRSPRLYDARQYPQGSPRAYDGRRTPNVWDEAAMTWARVPGSSSPRSERFGYPPPAHRDPMANPAFPQRRQSRYPNSGWDPFAALENVYPYPQGLAAGWMPSHQQSILPLTALGARSVPIGSPVLHADGKALKSEVDQHNQVLYACGALQKQIDVMHERISEMRSYAEQRSSAGHRSKSSENQIADALEAQIDAMSKKIDVIYERVSDKRSKSHENLPAKALQDQINAMSKRVSDLAIYATHEQGLSTCSVRGLLLIYADNRTCIVHTHRTCRGLPRHSAISHYLLNIC